MFLLSIFSLSSSLPFLSLFLILSLPLFDPREWLCKWPVTLCDLRLSFFRSNVTSLRRKGSEFTWIQYTERYTHWSSILTYQCAFFSLLLSLCFSISISSLLHPPPGFVCLFFPLNFRVCFYARKDLQTSTNLARFDNIFQRNTSCCCKKHFQSVWSLSCPLYPLLLNCIVESSLTQLNLLLASHFHFRFPLALSSLVTRSSRPYPVSCVLFYAPLIHFNIHQELNVDLTYFLSHYSLNDLSQRLTFISSTLSLSKLGNNGHFEWKRKKAKYYTQIHRRTFRARHNPPSLKGKRFPWRETSSSSSPSSSSSSSSTRHPHRLSWWCCYCSSLSLMLIEKSSLIYGPLELMLQSIKWNAQLIQLVFTRILF